MSQRLVAMMVLLSVSMPPAKAIDEEPIASGESELSITESFCKKTLPQYAQAYQEGSIKALSASLVEDSIFHSLNNEQKEAFFDLTKRFSKVSAGTREARCARLIDTALNKFSALRVRRCQIWKKVAETLLLASRKLDSERLESQTKDVSRRFPAMSVPIKRLQDQIRRIRPGVGVKKYGWAVFTTCMTKAKNGVNND